MCNWIRIVISALCIWLVACGGANDDSSFAAKQPGSHRATIQAVKPLSQLEKTKTGFYYPTGAKKIDFMTGWCLRRIHSESTFVPSQLRSSEMNDNWGRYFTFFQLTDVFDPETYWIDTGDISLYSQGNQFLYIYAEQTPYYSSRSLGPYWRSGFCMAEEK